MCTWVDGTYVWLISLTSGHGVVVCKVGLPLMYVMGGGEDS